jgi:hypothetical protein
MMLLVEAVRSSRSSRASHSVFTMKGTWGRGETLSADQQGVI